MRFKLTATFILASQGKLQSFITLITSGMHFPEWNTKPQRPYISENGNLLLWNYKCPDVNIQHVLESMYYVNFAIEQLL